jgi:hypothetical protein
MRPRHPSSGTLQEVACTVSAKLQSLSFDGQFLERGFWLYVWDVIAADGHSVFYVGMTGDSSSANAQSPFSRLSQHLGSNRHANALRRQLAKAGIEPAACRSFEMVAYGPIFPHAGSQDEHKASWRLVSAMEKALRDALQAAGYTVLNDVKCRQPLVEAHWREVFKAFSGRFEKLRNVRNSLGDAG